MKRSVYILGGIVVIVIIALVIFFLWKNNSSAPNTGTGTTGTLPSVGTQTGGGGAGTTTAGGNGGSAGSSGSTTANSLGLAFNDPVFEYFVGAQDELLVVEPDGKIAQVINNQPTYLNTTPISDLLSAGFSYDGEKIFVNFGDPANPQTSVFNVATKAWIPLPQGIISPAWSPSDYRLAYLQTNTSGTETISTIDLSKSTPKPVQLITLNANDLRLGWPAKNQLALYDKASTYVEGSAWLFDLAKKALTPVILERDGLEIGWDTATTSVDLAFSGGAGNQGGQLQLINTSGGTLQTLNFIGLPSKCAFSFLPTPSSSMAMAASTSAQNVATTTPESLALYCGVPRNQNVLTFTELPDAYDQMDLFTSDDIYEINAQTGTTTPLFYDQTKNFDISDMKIADDVIFFVNRYDQKLYALSLAAQQ